MKVSISALATGAWIWRSSDMIDIAPCYVGHGRRAPNMNETAAIPGAIMMFCRTWHSAGRIDGWRGFASRQKPTPGLRFLPSRSSSHVFGPIRI